MICAKITLPILKLIDLGCFFLFFHASLDDTDKDNTAIIVGVTVPILLMVALAIGLLIRKRRSQGRKTTETRATDDLSLPDSVIETR